MRNWSIFCSAALVWTSFIAPVPASVYPVAGINSGSWPDSVPIEVPPAVGDLAPDVAIDHDHQHRDGILGTGYRLSATSVITRHSASGGVPTIGGDASGSTFRLNGESLVHFDSKLEDVRTVIRAWTGLMGAASVFDDHFEPEFFSGARLTYSPSDNAWTMRNKGWTWVFGSRPDTGANATKMRSVDLLPAEVQADPGAIDTIRQEGNRPQSQERLQCNDGTSLCKTVAWLLSKSVDPSGNQVLFNYEVPQLSEDLAERLGRVTTHQHLLSRISYSGGAASVNFRYEPRPDPRLTAASGLPTVLQQRLIGISSEVQGKPYSDYVITYQDAEVSEPSGTRQTLVRRIIRRDTVGNTERVLRLVDTHRARAAWPSWTEAESLSAVIAQPKELGGPRSTVSSIPMEINIDGDGVSDLAVLAWSCTNDSPTTCTSAHRAYLATPGEAAPFVDRNSATGAQKTAIDAWEEQLDIHFDGDFAAQGRGYLIGDLDGDGRQEMLVESAPPEGQAEESETGPVIWVRHLGGDAFTTGDAAISGCALRSSRLGDIDGDGLVDLLRMSHRAGDACPAADEARWVKNTAAVPYFDWETNQTMAMPLDGPQPPKRWLEIVDQETLGSVCYGKQVQPPADFSQRDDNWSSTSDFARFGDFNSDGLLDVAYAMPGCYDWVETPQCEYWTGVAGALYSEIHYGLGDGTFLASEVHTGIASFEYTEALATPGTGADQDLPGDIDIGDILDPDAFQDPGGIEGAARSRRSIRGESEDAGTRSLLRAGSPAWCVPEPKNNALFTADLDRSGYAALLRSEQGVSELAAAFDRGLLDGFGLTAAQPVPQDVPGDASTAPRGIDVAWVFGDFDGDGFTDRIAMLRTGWDVRLARSAQEIAQGRVTRSEASWGGRTDLSWGFSTEQGHDNPDLSVGMEVLTEIDGRRGKFAFRYGLGLRTRSGFRGFGWVERTNERGARTEFGFYTDHARRGKPSYGARYRADGTIEEASVYIVGARASEAGTYSYDLVPPYFSPVLRQCDFAVGRTSERNSMVSIAGLLEDCHEFGDQTIGKGPFGVFESATDIDAQLPDWWLEVHPSTMGTDEDGSDNVSEAGVGDVDVGQPQAGSDAVPAFRQIPGTRSETIPAQSVGRLHGPRRSLGAAHDGNTPPTADIDSRRVVSMQRFTSKAIADKMVVDLNNGLLERPIDRWRLERDPTAFRSALPEGLKVPEDPELPERAPIDAPPTVKIYVKDFYYDHAERRLDRVADQRSTETHDDDLQTVLQWEKTSPQAHWYRLIEAKVTDYVGAQYARINRGEFATHGFNLAGVSTHCGRSDTACRTERFAWDGSGSLVEHTLADSATESWSYHPVCGKVTHHIDAVGRTRRYGYDDLCRKLSEEYLVSSSTFEYDGLNRLHRTHFEPGGSMSPLTITTLQDDAFANRLDTAFDEPRLARLRQDGQLQLTYLDEHGRTTLKKLCMNGGAPDPDSINDVACAPGTAIMADWTGYSIDGQVKARAEPWTEGASIATSLYTSDEAGRTVAVQRPAHVRAEPGEDAEAWLLSTFDFGPGWKTRTDPLGRVYREDTAPLERTRSVNGKRQQRTTWNAYGQLIGREGPDGLLTRYTYDDFNQLATEGLSQTADCWTGEGANASFGPCTYTLSFGYDDRGRLVKTAYPDGTVDEVELDSVGRPLRRWHRAGASRDLLKSWVYTDGDDALVVETRDESGNLLRRESDANGQTTRETFLGITTNWTYHLNGKPAKKVDTNGLETRYVYDIYDRLTAIDRPDSGITTFAYDASGSLLERVDADGVRTKRSYFYSGKLASRHLGDWLVERRGYDDAGRLVELDEGGTHSRIRYDLFDNVLRMDLGIDQDAQQPSAWIEQRFDDAHRPVRQELWPVEGQSAVTRYEYNPWGWITRTLDADGHPWIDEYDVRGRVRFAQDPEGYRAETRYDSRGRVVRKDVAGADSQQLRYATGVNHRLVGEGLRTLEVEDGEGSVTTFFYDGLGRKLIRKLADGTSQRWRYEGDRLGSRLWLDADGATLLEERLVYDVGTGRVAAYEGPARPDVFETGEVYSLSLGYSPAGRLIEIRIPGTTTTYQRDAVGLIQIESTDGLVRRHFREGVYPRLTRTELEGTGDRVRETRYNYDPAGRLIEMSANDGAGTETWRWGEHDAYDQPGWSSSLDSGAEIVAQHWDYSLTGQTLRRETSIGGTPAGATEWRYYRNGVPREIIAPSGRVERHVYGTPFDHRLQRVENRRGRPHGEVTARNGRGQPVSVRLASGRVLELEYDALGRPSAQRALVRRALESSWEGERDPLGRLISETQRAGGLTWRNDYAYDAHGRLERETVGWSGATFTYGWDLAGNRLSTTLADADGRRVLMEADYRGHRLSTVNGLPVKYDPWGAIVSDQNGYGYERSAGGRLRGISNGTARYEIARDAQGLPWAIAQSGRQRIHHWGLDPATLPLEVTGAGGTRAYVAADGLVLERLDRKRAGRVVRKEAIYGVDGSLETLSGSPVHPATAFGEAVVPPQGLREPFLYQGMQTLPKAPDIQLARHRAYDPQTGRFQSPDPAGFLGGPHRYAYVGGDPVNSQDPMGLWSVSIDAGVVASDNGSDPLGSALPTHLVEPEPPPEREDRRSGPTISEMLEAERRSGCPPGVICHPQGTGMAKEDDTADAAKASTAEGTVWPEGVEAGAVGSLEGDLGVYQFEFGRDDFVMTVQPNEGADDSDDALQDYRTGYAPGPALDTAGDEDPDGYVAIRLQALEEVATERAESAMETLKRLNDMAMDPFGTLKDVTPVGQVLSGQKTLLEAVIEQNALVGGAKLGGAVASTVGSGFVALANTPEAFEQIVTGQDTESVKAGVNGLVDSVTDQTEAAAILFPSATVGTLAKRAASGGFKRAAGKVPRVPDGDPCRCLLAGTPIETTEGQVSIEEIAVGDIVETRDPETGELKFVEVSATWERYTDSYLRILLEDGEGATLGAIEITEDHPVWIEDRGWTPAGDVGVGEKLRGEQATVVANIENVEHAVQVYNLTVPGAASFFAGDAGILLHNCHHDSVPEVGKDSRVESAGSARGRRANELGWAGEVKTWERLLRYNERQTTPIFAVQRHVKRKFYDPTDGYDYTREFDFQLELLVDTPLWSKGQILNIESKANKAKKTRQQKYVDDLVAPLYGVETVTIRSTLEQLRHLLPPEMRPPKVQK